MTRLPETQCPLCRHRFNCAEVFPVEGESVDFRPERGDITVCLNCAGVLIYRNKRGQCRAPTTAELDELAGNPLVQRAVAAISAMHEAQGRGCRQGYGPSRRRPS